MNVKTPKVTPAVPRRTSAHQFRARVSVTSPSLPRVSRAGASSLAGDGQPLRPAVVVLICPRVALGEPRGAKGAEIGCPGLAVHDPLGQAAPDGRRRLERCPGVAQHRVEAIDGRDLVDDRPPVAAHHDHARPAASHRRLAEHRQPRRQRLPAAGDVVAVHALVELVRIAVARAELDADQRAGPAFRAKPRVVDGVDDGSVPPRRRAASAKAKVVALGSANPESASHAAAPTSSTRQPGRRRASSSVLIASVRMPIALWTATLWASEASQPRPTIWKKPTGSKPQSPPTTAAKSRKIFRLSNARRDSVSLV